MEPITTTAIATVVLPWVKTAALEGLKRLGLAAWEMQKDDLRRVAVRFRLAPVLDPSARKLAWITYVQLTTRISLVSIADDRGFDREALSSLHAMFGRLRSALEEVGPDSAQQGGDDCTPVGTLIAVLLNVVLRPFLSTWHPALERHEAERGSEGSKWAHEQRWEQHVVFRQQLEILQDDLTQLAIALEQVMGLPALASLRECGPVPELTARPERTDPSERPATPEGPMQVVRAKQPFPESWSKAIFLAGPALSWQSDALATLEKLGYDGVVFVPEPAGAQSSDPERIVWETEALHLADIIVFWVPRALETPSAATDVVLGRWIDSHKCVLGHPPETPRVHYLDALLGEVTSARPHATFAERLADAAAHKVPGRRPHATLEETLAAAVARIGGGARRSAGERYVPLQLWNTSLFQGWYANLQRAGNRLDEARIRWSFFLPGPNKLFAAVLWVRVWVATEGRHKANEWIFGRSDMSAVVLYQRGADPGAVLDTEIVLVREFRSPARTPDGFVHELPGGSSLKENADPREVASKEIFEEAKLTIAPERLVPLGSRQAAATVSTHHVFAYAAALSPDEMATARQRAEAETILGNEAETERTVVEITTLREMLAHQHVDWSTLGMVAQALLEQ